MSNPIHQSQPPQATIDQIIGLYNQGQLEQTVSLGESLATQYPDAIILYDILGAAYMGLKNADKTIASYQKALKLNPNHTDAYNNIGMALYDQGRFDEAVRNYQKAVRLEPSFADALYNLGNALKQTGDLRQAIESYKASLTINPNDAEVLLNYGTALKSYGDFDKAIEAYVVTLKIDPNSVAAQTNMDNVIEEKAQIDKLVADYARITKLEIESAEIVSFTGTLLKARGYPEAAMESYNQALKIKPDYAEAYTNMGNAHQAKGDLDAAIDSYKQALKIKPDYADAYYNMGNALQEKGDLDAAIDSYEQAVKLFSNDAAAVKKTQPRILKAIYQTDDKSRISKKLDELIGLGYNNAIVGSISSRAALKFGVAFENPFCNDPINYVFEKSLLKLCNFADDFVKPSKKVLGFEKASKRNQPLLINGIQTAGNLFSTETYFAEEVQKIIRIELEKYRDKFKGSSEGLILSWPRAYILYGWLVSMKSGGAIRPHMHDNGWMSGSIYINVPQSQKKDSGNLVICVNDTCESPKYKQIIDVNTGSLCLFPSSLLHYTIPFESTEERIVLAFDMIPQ